MKAFIAVDIQNDFCEGGSLAVAGGAKVAADTTAYLRAHKDEYALVVATRDYHVDPGEHFAGEEGPNFTTTWPVHCQVGTPGAKYHPDFDTSLVTDHVTKGEYEAAYSGFEGAIHSPGEHVALAFLLHDQGVSSLDIAGIATDYCVRATALDAQKEGFAVRVLLPLTAGVAPESTKAAIQEMRAAGIEVVEDL